MCEPQRMEPDAKTGSGINAKRIKVDATIIIDLQIIAYSSNCLVLYSHYVVVTECDIRDL